LRNQRAWSLRLPPLRHYPEGVSRNEEETGVSPATLERDHAVARAGALPLLLGVDSDPRVARALERELQRGFAGQGFSVACVDGALPALELLSNAQKRGEPVALVLVDQGLPEMTGIGLLKEACRLHPNARSTLLIRHAELDLALDAVNETVVDHFLVKPWDWERDLRPIVADLLETWQALNEREAAGVTVVGDRHSWHSNRIRGFLDRNLVHYRWVDADCSQGEASLEALSENDRARLPVVFLPDGPAVAQPSNVEIARRLGIATKPSLDHYDLLIIGGGPAGLAAAVYGSSEGLSTVTIESEAPGGQAGQSSRIENYLGFHYALPGAELTRRAIIQARRFGAEIVRPCSVISLEADGGDRTIQLSDHTTLQARSVVVATGVEYRRLRAAGVAELTGAGVYYGAAPRDAADYVEKHVFIIGGANSAGQAALQFAEHAGRVTMFVRADSLHRSMSRYLIDKIESVENIEVLTNTELVEAHGSGRLEALSLAREGRRLKEPLPADALFIFIGAVPRTDWLSGTLARDDRGFILSGRDLTSGGALPAGWPVDRDPYPLETSMPGVFVAGDARRGSTKRVASAVGEGSMAVQLVHQYLEERA
jgi:thioredoxin reductase (NADPH)